MSLIDLDQVLYARARWRKRILIPLWTFQMAVLLCLMGIFAYRLAETFEHYEEHDKLGEMPVVEVVWEATNVGFNVIALILTILEIARKATERLTPFMMVCTQVVKLTLAFAVLALDIVAYLRRMDGHYSTIGLSLDCDPANADFSAANLAALIYALITYRRLLKYEEYHLTANAKAQGYVPHDSVELSYNSQHKAYPRTVQTDARWSKRWSEYSSGYPPQTEIPPSQPASGAEFKKVVDRAIDQELGYDPNPVNRSGSVVVASGKVAVHHGMMAVPAPELQRQRSWVTERGVIAEVTEAEAEGEEDEGTVLGGGRHSQGGHVEDREALLSPQPGSGK
ncbi:hypothetical protein C8A03DRAFT_10957 [Achaetomium macrosporum]|uniref:Uncharacterized protein n=1 Tax=Achaetomium macrosporum TaxID=79813 RepID=A0AAN7CIS9_9PEZI|nr:hypothetical protein C8A03DRAFT_10957 [Achaetomium macrosporum]